MNLIIQSRKSFFFKIYRSFSCDMWSKAPLISRFSIDTTQPGWACHAAWTLEVIREIADRVDRFFLAPICVRGSRSCASAAPEYICIVILLYTASLPELLAQFLATVTQERWSKPAPAPTCVHLICSISLSLQPAPA